MLKSILLSALLPLAVLGQDYPAPEPTYVEEVDGFTFIKGGPKDLDLKIAYERDAAYTALRLLKKNLTPDQMVRLLGDEIEEANVFWRDVVAKSTPDKWVPTDGIGKAFLPGLTAEIFAAWMFSPRWDATYIEANPEHYFKRNNATFGASEIVEGWGGVTTHFTLQGFGPANTTKWPMLRELPDYPLQVAADKVLIDGTKFGILHIAAKNIEDPKYGKGIETFATVWYGDASEDDHVELERQHITNEIINNAYQAYKDLQDPAVFDPVPILKQLCQLFPAVPACQQS